MGFLNASVEERILAAQARGEFDNLPGAGKPLDLDTDLLIPSELRMAYRLLKNAGVVPPEVETLRTIRELAIVAANAIDGTEHTRALKRLELLRLQLATAHPDSSLSIEAIYYNKLVERLQTGTNLSQR